MSKVKQWGSWFQNKSEYLNVSATAIAAVRISQEVNPGFKPEEHIDWAIRVVDYTQPDNAQWNKPIFGRKTDIGKLAYLLRTYPIAIGAAMINDMRLIAQTRGEERRVALTRFVGQHGMMVLLGGISATPIGLTLLYLLAGLQDDDEILEKLNPKEQALAYIRRDFGEDVGIFARRGVTPGIDLSNSLELSPLIFFRMPETDTPPSIAAEMAMQFLGPLGSWANRVMNADRIGNEDILRHMQAASPRAFSGVFEVMRWARDDMHELTQAGGYIADVELHQAVLRLLGFQPSTVADAKQLSRAYATVDRKISMEQKAIIEAAVLAYLAGEPDYMAPVEDYNARYAGLSIDKERVENAIERRIKAFADDATIADRLRGTRKDAITSAFGTSSE